MRQAELGLGKKIFFLLLFVFAAYLISFTDPVNQLCKYLLEKPGITVFFQYEYATGTDAPNTFEADLETLKSKLKAQHFNYKIGMTSYALVGQENHHYRSHASAVIELNDKDVDKVLEFLDINYYQHSGVISLKTLKCWYKPGYNLGYQS